MITKKISEIEIEIIDGDRGLNYPKEDEFSSSGFCLFLSAKNVTKEGFKIDNCQFITEYKDSLLGQGKLKRNDVILTTRGTVGNTAYYNERVVYNHIRINSGMVILRNNDNRIDNTYLVHFLSSPLFIQQINRIAFGSAQPQLTVKTINDISILFPKDINCQNHISKILNTFNFVLEQTQLTIAKYKNIKQGLLHDMFTRGLGANGNLRPTFQQTPELYKESKLGMIPKEWEVKRLEECTNYVDYRGKTPPKSERGIVLVTAKNIRFGYIDYELSKEYIYEFAFDSAMSRGKAHLGDVLITTEAPMGNVAQIDKEGIALAQRVIKYQGYKELLDNDFLKLALMSDGFQKTLLSEATGSTALGIKGSRLHKLKILIPNIIEQKEIAKRIKIIDNKIQSEEMLLSKWLSIKRGLMGDLLSGKKEV
jgi:type I restriction enzyme S subunit